jgi:phospholipase D1/2
MSGKPKFSPWSSLLAPYLLIHEGKIIHSSFGGLAKFDELSSHEPLISFSKSRSTMEPSRICIEGKNCCAITRANRVALSVDGDVYFTTLALALERAQRFILIAGWQLDSRLRLNPRDPESPCFGDFLHALVRRNRKLRIYVLLWDFAMIYAADREIIPLYTHPWRTHRRIHFRLDNSHPLGGSHHQKIVVVDDAVAFAGGLDIAEHRWDTPDHLPQDPRRVDSLGRFYPPYHDVQLMVDSDAAATLGQLVRERWHRATGKRLRAAARLGDPWPLGVTPDLEHVPVAISRTEPAYDVRQEVREVEALYIDSIRHARRLIYLENQYLTSLTIGNALAARLQEPDGPEIIMVLPQETSEWLEQVSMAVLRSRFLKRLRAADRFGRLHLYYPAMEGTNVQVRVHSKVCFIDDRLLRVGSSNLNNRSMGLDTECDLAVEAADPSTMDSIARLRNQLLAEHLGTSPGKVAETHAEEGLLARAIEKLGGGHRSLEILDGSVSAALDAMVPEAAVVDPERPLNPDELMQEFISPGTRRRAAPGLIRLAVMLLGLAALAVVWRTTALPAFVDDGTITSWTWSLIDSGFAPLWIAGIFTVGTLMLTPVTLLIIATGITFGPVLGFSYALYGALVSALVSYGLGRLAGREALRRLAGVRLARVQRQISRHGFISMLFARIIPIAPFAIVNLVAGAIQIRLRDFFLGTVVGMSPGIFAIVVLANRLQRAVEDPAIGNITLLIGLAIFFAFLGGALYRWYSSRPLRSA